MPMRAPVAAATLAATLCAAPAASAGGRIDLYLSEPGGGDASLRLEQRSLFSGTTREEARFGTGASRGGGIRVAGWGDTSPWLLALDAHGYTTDNCCLDLTVLDLSLSGGLRAPRPLFRLGGGGLHPYLLAGFDLAMVDGEARTATLRTDIGVPTGADAHVGHHVGAGLDWQASPRFGLVLEYRQTTVPLDTLSTNSLFFPTENTRADGRLETRDLRLGFSWLLASPRPTRQDAPPAEDSPGGPP